MRLTFLGTGTSTGVPVITCDCAVCTSDDPRDKRLRPSILLEWDGRAVLVDTSTDLRQQALRHGLVRLDAILFTHGHADHLMGLDEVRLFNWRQRASLPVYGSAPTLEAVRRSFWYVFEDVEAGGGKPALELHVVEAPFPLFGRTVVPVPVMHGTLPVTGWRIGRLAYLTDVSAIPDASWGLLEGLDLLVLSALRFRPHPTHLTLPQAITVARRIGARRTLFTHIAHEIGHEVVSRTLPAGCEIAWDGLAVDVSEPGP